MPIRLTLLLAFLLLGFLMIAYQNPDPFLMVLLPGVELNLTVAVITMAAFMAGALSVFFLAFFDAFAGTVASFKQFGVAGREKRVAQLFADAQEQLALDNRLDARKLLKNALATNHDHIPSLMMAGRLDREAGEWSEAIKSHSKVCGLDPEALEGQLELARDYAESEQYQNALTILNRLREKAGRALPPLIAIRDVYIRVKNFEQALDIQKKVVSLAPHDRLGHEKQLLAALQYEHAARLVESGDYEVARKELKTVVKTDPDFIPAYLKLAEVDERTGRKRESIKVLEKAFKHTRSMVLLKYIETLFRRRDEPGQAASRYRWAQDIAPDQGLIRVLHASAALDSGDAETARQALEIIEGDACNTTLYHLVRANVEHAGANVDKALESLKEAFAAETASVFIFACSSCNKTVRDYSARCDSCGQWNSLTPLLS